MPDEGVKILVVGPSQVGKTCIADFLSGTRDTPPQEYKETKPLRILETVMEGLHVGGGRRVGRGTRAVVELWDVGGSSKFQSCWPAIQADSDAIIFVMNPEVDGQERELEFWHKSFAGDIKDNLKLVFCHHSSVPTRAGSEAIPQMPRCLVNAKLFETSLDFQSDNFKEAFEHLVEDVLGERRKAEEEEALKNNDVMAGAIGIRSGQ